MPMLAKLSALVCRVTEHDDDEDEGFRSGALLLEKDAADECLELLLPMIQVKIVRSYSSR